MNTVTPRGYPTTAQTNVEAVKGSRSALDIAFLWGSLPRFLQFVEPPAGDPPAPPDNKPDPIATLRSDFEAKFAEQEAKLNSAHAEIRKLRKTEPPPAPPGDGDPPTPPAKKTAADKELDARLAKIEARDLKVAKNAKRTALSAGFAGLGITGEALSDAIDLFMARNGERLIYDDENDAVLFKHSEIEDPKQLNEYLASEAKAGRFNRFKAPKDAPKAGPAAGGQGGGGDGKVEVSGEQMREMLANGTLDPKAKYKVVG